MSRAVSSLVGLLLGRVRSIVAVLILAILSSGCGGADSGGADSTDSAPATTNTGSAVSTTTTPRPRTAARWESLTTLSSEGAEPKLALALAPEMIQWRLRWTCESGALRIETTPPPRKPRPLVDASCPGKGEAISTLGGSVDLSVEASAPWSAVVDQQVDTPLAEAPLAEMSTAPVLVEGAFYDLEKEGSGTARLYQLDGGRRVLRFEDFSVSQNTDLFIWLSEAPSPKTSAEAVAAPKVVLGELRATLGNQNYEIPPEVPTDRIRSIVIWCQPVAVAYSAAALVR